MKAVVLAAGKGRRLWPLTETRPKPMIPVANQPILEHILDALESVAVEEVIFVVGANRERVQNYFGNGQDRDIEISYVVQEPQLGTGHALLQAESQIGNSFIALNGDRIIAPEVIESIWDRQQATQTPTMAVTRVKEPSQYGVVTLEGRTVTQIHEQPHPDLAESDFINAGVYAFTPDIFAAIRQTDTHGEQALTDALTTYIQDKRLQAVPYQGRWLDVSEPWDLLTVNAALLAGDEHPPIPETTTIAESAVVVDNARLGDGVGVHPQAAVLDNVTMGDNVTVGPGAILENAILLGDVTIKRGAVVTDCVVGANTTVGPNTTIEGGATEVVLNDTVYHDVTFGALIGDNVTMGGNVTITPGTIVGTDATLGSGTYVSGHIDDGSHIQRG
ncbi:glucose-1-phosphate thymidylyltransferase [Halobellus sp. Atlit-38R]|nr:sugar phosphate nucleotidyltransferase [Halobellus sp. Atlit-38R]RLM83759.1 glucose-1-phosphate thymidylyltransferase [Halobellus sp. Atlit-38R]